MTEILIEDLSYGNVAVIWTYGIYYCKMYQTKEKIYVFICSKLQHETTWKSIHFNKLKKLETVLNIEKKYTDHVNLCEDWHLQEEVGYTLYSTAADIHTHWPLYWKLLYLMWPIKMSHMKKIYSTEISLHTFSTSMCTTTGFNYCNSFINVQKLTYIIQMSPSLN